MGILWGARRSLVRSAVAKSAVLALVVLVGAAACVEGPDVVDAAGTSSTVPGGVAAATQSEEAPSDDTYTTETTGPTTTKPRPATTTTETTTPDTTEPEPPEDDAEDPDGSGDPSDDADDKPIDYVERSIEYVNERRAENSTGALEEDPELTAMAEAWARQMAAEDNLYHNPNLFRDRPPGYRMVGENVAYNSNPGNIDDAWWESDGHRANILNEAYTHIGVAFLQDDRGIYWGVQVFAG